MRRTEPAAQQTSSLVNYRERVAVPTAGEHRAESTVRTPVGGCQHCGTELADHPPGHPGRPPKYCSVICRQAAHRARRRRSVSQPEHVRRPFQAALRELMDSLRQQAERLDDGSERYGAEARVLVELANSVRDVAVAHDRTVGDSWTAVAKRVDTTPAKAQDHCQSGLRQVALFRERGQESADEEQHEQRREPA